MENNTVFVLLAGGKSERMGEAKGLLNYKNSFWILEQLDRISKTSITQVYIGLGYNYQSYFKAIPWFEKAIDSAPQEFKKLSVTIVINKTPELGSFSTLQTVLNEINNDTSIVLNHIDIPLLNSKELQHIIDSENEITFPNYKGKNGHPIKMKPAFWKTLKTIKPTNKEARLDIQLKKINPIKISIIEVSDRAILYNLNTPSEWKMYLNS